MSFSEYISASFTGHARKPSRISLAEAEGPSQQKAILSLREYFAKRRGDLAGREDLLEQIDGITNGDRKAIQVVGDLTRKQRKDVRLLGFDVNYAG